MSYEVRTDRVRVIIFLKQNSKRPRITSKEELGRSWIEGHTERFKTLDIVKKTGVKYDLVLIDDKLFTAPQSLGARLTALDEWDGLAIYEAESQEKIFEVLQSEEYQRVIGTYEQKFVIRSECPVLPLDLYTTS
ncbi:hypothetical protein DXG03_009127 [Asterophora parasitica]|uniref:EthD domain-containing protein n=1 Tax=Asterophora parasitica TaxID=117018 RepID=A0A9P7G5T5_9AGAR|nr:hypothetical protein DXG03_009127 [Asterophora parasitica]